MVLGSPMILFAQTLEASATVLGIISGMMPLLVVFQIPAANHIPRYGYKRFVYGGWGIRIIFIFLMAIVPMTYFFLNRATQLVLVLFLLFGFNLSRGISSCAWLPWITALVPERIRGKYLAVDAAFVNLASCAAMVFAGVMLGSQPQQWQFSVVFAFSAIMGVISLTFLKRIPDVASPEQTRSSTVAVPWLAMARYAPFRKLLWLNVAWAAAYGGMSAFTIAFLKVETAMSEATILLLNSVAFLGGLSSLGFVGNRLDQFGSKPVLMISLLMWLFILAGWILLAGRVLPTTPLLVLLLQLFMGLGAALVNVSNTRLAMAIVPVMGRNHFFAIFSVVANLSLGSAPVVWGLVIDAVGSIERVWHGLEWNRFSIFFSLASVFVLVTLYLSRKLDEPKAARMEELLRELLVASPQRFWLRFWPRS